MSEGNPYPIKSPSWLDWEVRKFASPTPPSSNCAFDDDSECVDDMLGGPSVLSDIMWRYGPGFVVGCYFTVGAAWVWSWFL